MPPAARKNSDKTVCQPGVTGTGTFTVVTGESANVKIGGEYAVCETDLFSCTGATPPTASIPCVTGVVKKGSSTVTIGYKPAARQLDPTQCNGTGAAGMIVSGCPTVIIGDTGGSGGGGATGGGPSGAKAGVRSQASALRAAKESGAAFCEVCEGVKSQSLSQPNSGIAAPISPPERPITQTCHLASMTVRCGHSSRGYVLEVGKESSTGHAQNLIEVVAGPDGDEMTIATTLDKPYCKDHIKKPLSGDPRKVQIVSVTPVAANGTCKVRPASIMNTFRNRPFALLWPQSIPPLRHTIYAMNCGNNTPARVDAYPDLRWTVGLSVTLGEDQSSSASMKPAKTGAGQEIRQTEETTNYSDKSTIKAEYGSTTIDYSHEFSSVIKKVSSVANVALDCLNRSSKVLGKYAGTSITFSKPNLFVRGEWGWKEIAESWQAGYEVKATAGFSPLIGVSVDVDIIAVLLMVTGSPALARLKKMLDGNVAEVGIYLKAEGSIAGRISVSKVVGQAFAECEGKVEGEIVVSLEGRIKAEKKWLMFKVRGEAKAGGRTTLSAEMGAFCDQVGFGLNGKLAWNPLTLYIDVAVSAGVEYAREDEELARDGRPQEKHKLGGEHKLLDDAHELWEEITLMKGKKYFIRNADT